MPEAEKARLVALCERQQVPLIEDDTYGALTDDDTPLAAAKSWDATGNVIYCSSMHKTLAPGMRLGCLRKAAPTNPWRRSPWPNSWGRAPMTGTWRGCAGK
ncbi:hypothetical protein G6F65_022227 [Rhizopus arrhizus]|nr:hypothetical protein G6F65_022227 [Rhizopus arrhizus]